MNTGKKTQIGKINVQPEDIYAGCRDSINLPPSKIMDFALEKGVNVGVVTTTRLTHATPAAVYGHSAERGFEIDVDLNDEAKALKCRDLADQMIHSGLSLALGGGRYMFQAEERLDKRDLTQEWSDKSSNHFYVSDAASFRAIPAQESRNVLGVFRNSHMAYEADRDNDKEPSLSEMTDYAITNLAAREGGYFLMIEGGRIDHAHHRTNAYRALTDTQELAEAVQIARDMTDPADTLILVTADHSHVFTMAGYQRRGNPIFGLAGYTDDNGNLIYRKDKSGNPYTTLGYHNGPNVERDKVLSEDEVTSRDYLQRAAVELDSETHSGEDVALYADGPGSEKARGVIDQAEIFDIIMAATGWNEAADE